MSDQRHPEVIAKEAIGLLRELAGADLTDLSDGEVLELAVLTTDAAKLATAAQVVAAGRVDVANAWVAEGARSASAWLAWRGHLPTSTSGAVLRCARQLRSLPAAERAFLAGRITLDHIRLLTAAQRTDPDTYAADEERLVELAQELLFSRFEVVIRYWRQHQDPDGAEDDAERCEIDHIQPYETGGPTTQANGRCYCPFHHRWRHRRTPPAA